MVKYVNIIDKEEEQEVCQGKGMGVISVLFIYYCSACSYNELAFLFYIYISVLLLFFSLFLFQFHVFQQTYFSYLITFKIYIYILI